MILMLMAVSYCMYQSFALRKQREKLAINYFIPFSILVFASFILYGVTILWNIEILNVVTVLLNGLYLFFLASGIKNLDTKMAIRNKDYI